MTTVPPASESTATDRVAGFIVLASRDPDSAADMPVFFDAEFTAAATRTCNETAETAGDHDTRAAARTAARILTP